MQIASGLIIIHSCFCRQEQGANITAGVGNWEHRPRAASRCWEGSR